MSRGLHLAPDSQDPLVAWQRALPAVSAFTHLTAAARQGWWLPPLPPDLPVFCAMTQADPGPRRPGLVVCRHNDMPPWLNDDGIRLTTPAETALACGRDLSELDLVVIVDAALHGGDCTLAELSAVAASRRRGAPRLRGAMQWAASGTPSGVRDPRGSAVRRVRHRRAVRRPGGPAPERDPNAARVRRRAPSRQETAAPRPRTVATARQRRMGAPWVHLTRSAPPARCDPARRGPRVGPAPSTRTDPPLASSPGPLQLDTEWNVPTQTSTGSGGNRSGIYKGPPPLAARVTCFASPS